ncbi:hypothetical protein D7X12_11655 [Corallococcus sicarius]|uniref:Uncharacterized protein n=1 Tax=Corallococcus sicarius TaxID=2316726 RepID=A0A3A8NX09_9BACT|nr:hypothetical protein D7X12_11655 [Corallococcus sicarius]
MDSNASIGPSLCSRNVVRLVVSRMLTVREVAEELAVCRATVSFTLTGSASSSVWTRTLSTSCRNCGLHTTGETLINGSTFFVP